MLDKIFKVEVTGGLKACFENWKGQRDFIVSLYIAGASLGHVFIPWMEFTMGLRTSTGHRMHDYGVKPVHYPWPNAVG